MALFDTLFGMPTREEREQAEREARLSLLRGSPTPTPIPTGPRQFERDYPPPEPSALPPPPARAEIPTGPVGPPIDQVPPERPQMPPVPPIPVPEVPITPPARPQALPKALGTGAGAPKPPGAPGGAPGAPGGVITPQVDPATQRLLDLRKQLEEATKPADTSAAQSVYDKQSEAGRRQLVLAMMAGEAGERMQPFQAFHLKQAAAAREPMKMVGGQMTESGFIKDPGYEQEQKIKRLTGQIEQEQRIIESAADRASKEAAEKRLFAHQEKLARAQQATTLEAAKIAAAAKERGPGGRVKMSAGDDKEVTDSLQGLSAVSLARKAVRAAPSAFGASVGTGLPDLAPGTLGQMAMTARDRTLTDEELYARNAVYNQVSALITKRAGTAQSAAEQKRLNSFLPGPLDNAEDILVKLQQYEDYLRSQGEVIERKYGVGAADSMLPPREVESKVPYAAGKGGGGGGGLPAGWSVRTK